MGKKLKIIHLKKLYTIILLVSFFLFNACNPKENPIITVNGKISPGEMGKTLHHEHLLVDFIGADSTGYHRWNKDSVVERVLPYLLEIKKLGYKTLVECTPAYVGRDPELLKMLANQSGMQLITNTGYYSAVDAKFLPPHAFTESAEELAQRWIRESENGIEETGVFPGFIKIAVERKSLEPIHKKIIEAAGIAHKATGLTIMSHTGPAIAAFEQIEILEKNSIHPSAFIWTHAQNEADFNNHIKAAKKGTWVAFDNFSVKQLIRYVEFGLLMKKEGLLHKVLFSHDAGWYSPGEPNGGEFRGFTEIDEILIPALQKNGLSQQDIHQLFVLNPAEAFQVKQRIF